MKLYAAPVAIAAVCALTLTTSASAQERRGGPERQSFLPDVPKRSTALFAGVWEGARVITDGAEPEMNVPTVMVFEGGDKGASYTGYQVFPNGGKGPYERVILSNGTLTFRHRNSGGGDWMYSARLAGEDTLKGSVVLKDWPQGSGRAPKGTFVLVRRRSS